MMEILSGYKLRNTECLDARNQVATKNELLNAALSEWDDGHFVYCLQDKTYYQLDKTGTIDPETGYFKKFEAGSAIIDVALLPTTDIKTDAFYRTSEATIYINGEEKEGASPIIYCSIIDASVVQVSSTQITVNGVAHNWEDVSVADVDDWYTANYITQESSPTDDTVIFGYYFEGNSLFTAYSNVQFRDELKLYQNKSGSAMDWQQVGGEQDVEAIIDVALLPTTDIKTKLFYRVQEQVYKHNDDELYEAPTGYAVLSSDLTVGDTGITYEGTTYLWNDTLNDTVIEGWITNNLIEETTTNPVFYKYDTDGYDKASTITTELSYVLYQNPTGLSTDWKKVGGGKGGSADVDNNTITKNDQAKLQANAVLFVNELPTGNDILPNSLYSTTESTPTTMIKLWRYDGTKFVSLSTIHLTSTQYDALTNDQKADGTTYIVSDSQNTAITWVYSNLGGKPVINGITIDGILSLEDLSLYSRNEVNNLLAQKGNAVFVEELPTSMQKMYWYYSEKYDDGSAVPAGKRALYILDNNNVLQFLGITGDVDLSNYYLKTEADEKFVSKQNFLNTIYPKGSIYITYENKNPSTFLGGTWELIDSGSFLRAVVDDSGGTYLDPQLPNIKGSIGGYYGTRMSSATGAFKYGTTPATTSVQTGMTGYTITFNASTGQVNKTGSFYPSADSVYKDNGEVRPKSYNVYVWKRTDDAEVIFNMSALTVKQIVDDTATSKELASAKAIYDALPHLYEHTLRYQSKTATWNSGVNITILDNDNSVYSWERLKNFLVNNSFTDVNNMYTKLTGRASWNEYYVATESGGANSQLFTASLMAIGIYYDETSQKIKCLTLSVNNSSYYFYNILAEDETSAWGLLTSKEVVRKIF